jgi:hypothetical protein
MLSPDPARLAALLATDGYACMEEPLDDDGFVTFARALGEIVDDTLVRVVPGKRTYLARPDPIPLHTDHPSADCILWRCEAQDARDGASLLVDGLSIVAELDDEDRAVLARMRLPAMVRFGDPALPTAILSYGGHAKRVFYAPWLEPMNEAVGGHDALVRFRRALACLEKQPTSIRLEPGQVLIVDNRRMLHGRGRLAPETARRLRRLWVRSTTMKNTISQELP